MKICPIPVLLSLALSGSIALAQVPDAPPPPEPRSTVAQEVDDASISSKVRDAISADSQLEELEFTVDTTDGVVTLNGTASTSEQIARAVALARSVDGVKSVTNILAVRTS